LWVSTQLGTSRTSDHVKTDTEKEFFQKLVLTFQKVKGTNIEADNFSPIGFGALTKLWNDYIREEEEGRREKMDMTLKSAFQLQLYWKKFRKDANSAATMLPIHEGNQSLRREFHHGQTRNIEVAVAPVEMAQDCVIRLASSASDAIAMPADETAPDDDFCFGDNDDWDDIVDRELILPSLEAGEVSDSRKDDGSDAAVIRNGQGTAATKGKTAEAPAVELTKQRKSRNGRRCALCGHECGKNSPYAMYHTGQGKRGRGSLQPKDVCTVPESKRKLNPDGTLPKRADWYKHKRKHQE
jgi:hypothetical protein